MTDIERDPLFLCCVRDPMQTSLRPRKSPKSGGEVPVQQLHRPIRHNCHTSANILICKQTIILCGCWDGRWGEGVSSPQVVRKPPQATGTLTATSAPHVHSSPQHLVSLLIFFLPKISQIWNVLISFLFSFWKKWFILIEPKGWGEPLEHIEAGRWKTGTHLFVCFVCRCSAVLSLDYEAKMFSF